MIKNVILLILIILPCLLAFNGSENVIVNVIGVLYMLMLVLVYKTKIGRKFFDRLASDAERVNERIFNFKEDKQ